MLQSSLSLLSRYACELSGEHDDCVCITKYGDPTEAGSERWMVVAVTSTQRCGKGRGSFCGSSSLVPWTECWSADGAVDEFWFSFLCRAFRARIALWHKAKLTKGVVLSFTSKMRLAPNQNTGIGTPEVTWDCSFRVCAPESCFSDTVSHSAGFIIFYIIYTICP